MIFCSPYSPPIVDQLKNHLFFSHPSFIDSKCTLFRSSNHKTTIFRNKLSFFEGSLIDKSERNSRTFLFASFLSFWSVIFKKLRVILALLLKRFNLFWSDLVEIYVNDCFERNIWINLPHEIETIGIKSV